MGAEMPPFFLLLKFFLLHFNMFYKIDSIMDLSKLVWMWKYWYMSPIEADILRAELERLGKEFLEDTKTDEDTSMNATQE